MDSDSEAAPENLLGASCFARAFFEFISPVIRMARTEGKLHEEDVPEHTMNLDTKVLFHDFNKEWQKQQTMEKPSMVRALAAGRWTLLIVTGVAYIMSQALTLAGPLFLKQIVTGLACRATPDLPGCEGGELRMYLCASSCLSACACSFYLVRYCSHIPYVFSRHPRHALSRKLRRDWCSDDLFRFCCLQWNCVHSSWTRVHCRAEQRTHRTSMPLSCTQ